MSFSKILIANRGEIACRVIRTARKLGYATVAVYSDADRQSPHVAMADEAVCIGASPASESYLRIDAVLQAAKTCGADAVHPGYGFLSENAAFAQACVDNGLVFIGPGAAAIQAMGDKALAKQRMIAAGVPCAPGYLGEDQSDAALQAQAELLGYPLLVKAVAGGGGRGMRLVRSQAEVQGGIEGAKREALSAFGDGTLMLERLIDNGRHIEIQVFADSHGQAVYLGERDCTAQRRRQKVIEEAPSPVVSDAMRAAMGKDAVAAALAVGYLGAGTVEFIVDDQLQHYFLEMNTRLQVEHPVTECITGYDLVEWQIRVASGEALPVRQEDIQLHGHAIEARLYAEDPYTGFTPQTGKVLWWKPEQAVHGGTDSGRVAHGVRIDHGIAEGGTVSPYYDPMVAKIIVHGRDRSDAIRRLRAALAQAPLLGLKNNAAFLSDLVDHEDFRAARMTTSRIDEWWEQRAPLLQVSQPTDAAWCAAALALITAQEAGQGSSLRSNSVASYDLTLRAGQTSHVLRVTQGAHGSLGIELSKVRHQIQVVSSAQGVLRLDIDGVQQSVITCVEANQVHLAFRGACWVFEEVSPLPASTSADDPSRALSPVAGKVTQVRVKAQDAVVEGQQLVCVEAMKMEMWLTAQVSATIGAVHVAVGDQVASGALLVELNTVQPKEA